MGTALLHEHVFHVTKAPNMSLLFSIIHLSPCHKSNLIVFTKLAHSCVIIGGVIKQSKSCYLGYVTAPKIYLTRHKSCSPFLKIRPCYVAPTAYRICKLDYFHHESCLEISARKLCLTIETFASAVLPDLLWCDKAVIPHLCIHSEKAGGGEQSLY